MPAFFFYDTSLLHGNKSLLALGTQGHSPMNPTLKVCPLQAHLFGSNLAFSSLLRLDPDSLFLKCTIRSWCLLGFCILALPCTRVSLCTGPFLGSFLFHQSVYPAPTQPILTSHRLFLVFLGGGKVLISTSAHSGMYKHL